MRILRVKRRHLRGSAHSRVRAGRTAPGSCARLWPAPVFQRPRFIARLTPPSLPQEEIACRARSSILFWRRFPKRDFSLLQTADGGLDACVCFLRQHFDALVLFVFCLRAVLRTSAFCLRCMLYVSFFSLTPICSERVYDEWNIRRKGRRTAVSPLRQSDVLSCGDGYVFGASRRKGETWISRELRPRRI